MTLHIYTHTYIYIYPEPATGLFILQINIIFSLRCVVSDPGRGRREAGRCAGRLPRASGWGLPAATRFD